MIHVCNSVIATELHFDCYIYENTNFQISEKVRTNGPLSSKYEIFEKMFFDPQNLKNVRNPLKISLSQDSWCSHDKQKNVLVPWRIGLNLCFYYSFEICICLCVDRCIDDLFQNPVKVFTLGGMADWFDTQICK